jgi:hypothetical protein
MMKRAFTLAAILAVFAAPGLAGHCPSDVAAIDEALKQSKLSSAQMSEIKAARDLGAELHKTGKHGESLKILHGALKALEVKHK